jgi:hypothetical protein
MGTCLATAEFIILVTLSNNAKDLALPLHDRNHYGYFGANLFDLGCT